MGDGMKETKLPESELKIMEIVWEGKTVSAKDAADTAQKRYGWKKNTTYTVLNNLVKKGFLTREEPGFLCKPAVSREQIAKVNTRSLLDKFYNGSAGLLFSCLIENKQLSKKELKEIEELIQSYEKR